jgi:hypothetical protein
VDEVYLMRRLLALVAALGMMAGLGCHHNTCETCDFCTGGCCGSSGVYTAPALGGHVGHAAPPAQQMPGPKPEEIKAMPMPKSEGAAPMQPPEG